MIDTAALQSLLELEALTDAQREAVAALIEHGAYSAAARALGKDRRVVCRAVARAMATHARLALGKAAPPIPFTPVRIATDGKGRVKSVTSRREPDATADGPHDPVPEGHNVKGISTYFGSDGSITGQWVKTDRRAQQEWAAFTESMHAATSGVVPVLPSVSPSAVDEDLVTWLPWGDPHIGLLAWAAETGTSFDLKICEEQTAQVMADLISRTPRSRQFVLADLGDLFHAEDDKQVTPTAGHKLDVDCRAGKIARIAMRIFRSTIDLALQRHAAVLVHLLRGNHDPYKSLMLGLWLEAVYANEPRVTIAPFDNPYQFWSWGANAVMLHHGDGSKPQQMPGVFSCDPSWGSAKNRYVYTGHIHSQNRWDLPGCSVESFRTLAASDYWAHHKGYRSKRTLDCITLHRELGEISRVQQGIRPR